MKSEVRSKDRESAETAIGAARRRRTQAERVAESDAKMFESAIRLIARQGYAMTTMEAIGTDAGYSRQLVAQRFGSKDNLLRAVLERHVEKLRQRFDHQAPQLGLSGLNSQIDAYLAALDEPTIDSRAFFILMLESIGPADQFRPVFARVNEMWVHSVARLIAKSQLNGDLRSDVDPHNEALLLVAALRGIRIHSLISPSIGSVASAAAALKQSLAERLSPVSQVDSRTKRG